MQPSHILGLVVGVVSAIAVLPLLIRYWPNEGKWGINSNPVRGPEFDQTCPRLRKPANRRQALWGGSTCPKCVTECDRSGKRVVELDR